MQGLIRLILAMVFCASAHAELAPLDDDSLSETQGQLNLVLNNFYVDAGDFGVAGYGVISVISDPWNRSELSELRAFGAGGRRSGINLGSLTDPIKLDLVAVDNGGTSYDDRGLVLDWPGTSDNINLHFRVDSYREMAPLTRVFDSVVDITGLHLNTATRFDVWSMNGVGPAFGSTLDLDIGELAVQTRDPAVADPNGEALLKVSNLRVRNATFGSRAQPFVFTSFTDGGGNPQIRFELASVSPSLPSASIPKANINIGSAQFGALTDIDSATAGNQFAFQPPSGQDLAWIKDLQIQHLRVTTRDLQ